MYSTLAVALSGLALVSAQNPPLPGFPNSPLAPVPGVTGELGDADVVSNNPTGVTYTAVLPDKPTTGIRGSISISSAADGRGVSVKVNFFGFPTEALGPFLYHIHDQPVPANGNCTATLAHLDPFVRGEVPPCLAADPASCQVGDLSGKHGNITAPGLQTSYSDLYISTKEGLGSFIGNRSIVVHTSNTTRLNCANFALSTSGSNVTNSTGGAGSTGGVSPPSPTSSLTPFTGGAATNLAGATAVVGLFVAAAAFFL